MIGGKATLQSQLDREVCTVEDTEEMFWLREADDYQSKVALGNALAQQYRFRDASAAYEQALKIRNDDPMTWLRLGGAELTLFHFDAAMEAFQTYLLYGGSEQSIAYHMGFWHYLQGNYDRAANWFAKCLPCGDEMKIAVIYWHTLASIRDRSKPALLAEYAPGMQVGHHAAYQKTVAVFCGEQDSVQTMQQIETEPDDLNYSITGYGLIVWLQSQGRMDEAIKLRESLLRRDAAWPCLSYLAAWNDHNNRPASYWETQGDV